MRRRPAIRGRSRLGQRLGDLAPGLRDSTLIQRDRGDRTQTGLKVDQRPTLAMTSPGISASGCAGQRAPARGGSRLSLR